jgi:hypothetical protein
MIPPLIIFWKIWDGLESNGEKVLTGVGRWALTSNLNVFQSITSMQNSCFEKARPIHASVPLKGWNPSEKSNSPKERCLDTTTGAGRSPEKRSQEWNPRANALCSDFV